MLQIDTELFLAYALAKDKKNEGLTYKDLERFEKNVKEMIFEFPGKDEIKSIYLPLSQIDIDYEVKYYPGMFRFCMGRLYKGTNFKVHKFDQRTNKMVLYVLKYATM